MVKSDIQQEPIHKTNKKTNILSFVYHRTGLLVNKISSRSFFGVILIALSISHANLYFDGYIIRTNLVLIILSDVVLFFPFFVWSKLNRKMVYFTCINLLFILNVIRLDIKLTLLTILLSVPILIIPLFFTNTRLAFIYLLIFGYALLSFTDPNNDLIYIDKLNIHYHPSILFMILYTPLLNTIEIETLILDSYIKKFIVRFLFLIIISQLINPLGFAIFMSIFLHAFIEEIIFRAWLFYELTKFMNNHIGKIIISSIIFSMVHIPSQLGRPDYLILMSLTKTFIIGIMLAFLYHKNNNILSTSLVHTILNLSVVL